jgi:hypothetical protein
MIRLQFLSVVEIKFSCCHRGTHAVGADGQAYLTFQAQAAHYCAVPAPKYGSEAWSCLGMPATDGG